MELEVRRHCPNSSNEAVSKVAGSAEKLPSDVGAHGNEIDFASSGEEVISQPAKVHDHAVLPNVECLVSEGARMDSLTQHVEMTHVQDPISNAFVQMLSADNLLDGVHFSAEDAQSHLRGPESEEVDPMNYPAVQVQSGPFVNMTENAKSKGTDSFSQTMDGELDVTAGDLRGMTGDEAACMTLEGSFGTAVRERCNLFSDDNTVIVVDEGPDHDCVAIDLDVADNETDADLQIVASNYGHGRRCPQLPKPVSVADGVEFVSSKVARLSHPGAVRVAEPVKSSIHAVDLLPSCAVCAACRMPLDPSASCECLTDNANRCQRHSILLSRCKHILCSRCSVLGIMCPSVCNADESTHPSVSWDDCLRCDHLRPLPTCPARRCRAPLSFEECHTALALPLVDDVVKKDLEKFQEWIQSGNTGQTTGFSVRLSQFSPELQDEILNFGDDPLISESHDDTFLDIFTPFWLQKAKAPELNEESGRSVVRTARAQRSAISWACVVCGKPGAPEGGSVWGNSQDRSSVTSFAGDSNDINRHPGYFHCSYARAYGFVLAMQGLSGVSSSLKNKTSAKKSISANPSSRKRKASTTYASGFRGKVLRKSSAGFAKGTGFGGTARRAKEWKGQSKRVIAKVHREDAERAFWFFRIKHCLLIRCVDNHKTWPGFMRLLVRDSGLVAVLASILLTESMMDAGERVPVFVAALQVVDALTNNPSLRSLVTEAQGNSQSKSVANLVDSLNSQAALLSAGAASTSLDHETSLLIKQIRRSIRAINRHNLLRPSKGHVEQEREEPSRAERGMDQTCHTSSAVDAYDRFPNASGSDGCLRDESQKPFSSFEQVNHLPQSYVFSGVAYQVPEGDKAEYKESMRKVQFETVPGLAQSSAYWSEAEMLSSSTSHTGSVRRIAGEVASLFSSLPLDWSSTIVLRVDEDRYDFLRACIFGPEGTPYDSGAFIFDIHLPATYPQVPPLCRLLTTGGGRIRFNPNLYKNGKVCLSLLGTWSGPTWTPASTLLQVLVSIQSLILVEQPYFNEPGYESLLGTPTGKQLGDEYNSQVHRNNVAIAMLQNILYSPPELRSAILTHFELKRTSIKANLRKWFPFEYSSALARNQSQHTGLMFSSRMDGSYSTSSANSHNLNASTTGGNSSSQHLSQQTAAEMPRETSSATKQDETLESNLCTLISELDKL